MICRLTQTSMRLVEAESVEEAGSDLEGRNNCRTAETAGSADQTARMPSVQALISLAEAPAIHSDYTDTLKPGTAKRRHLARFDSAAVWRMVDSLAVVLEPVEVLEEGRSSEVETRRPVAEVLEGVRLSVRLENAEVVAPESQRLLGHCQHPHLL